LTATIDIIDFGGKQGDIIADIMKNVNNSMIVKLHKIDNPEKWSQKLSKQSILLFEKFLDFADFNNKDLMETKYVNPIRLLVYCQNASRDEIASIKTNLVIPPYYYFVVYDKYVDKITLHTFENLIGLDYCHEGQQLVKINEFSSTTSQWTTEPIFPIKYKNFHACTMLLGVYNLTNFFMLSVQNDTFALDEFMTKLIFVISTELNFSTTFCLCEENDCSDQVEKKEYVYNILRAVTLDGFAVSNSDELGFLCFLLNIQCT
jgi:hypothetical protein